MSYFLACVVLLGAALITCSLPVARRICILDASIGWRVLFGLLVFFVLGYLLFLVLLLRTSYDQIYLIVSPILLGGGGFVYLVMRMTLQSISNNHRIAEIESHNASHDSLTGLPNRAHLNKSLNMHLRRLIAEGGQLAVMIIDLDRFKEINDTLGHVVGDGVLQEVSRRFTACLGESQLLARLGGDEFALLLPSAGEHEAVQLARKLRTAIETVIEVDDFPLTVDMSLGVALCPEHAEDRHSLLKVADIAMYQAKRSQRDFMLYEESMDNYSMRRLQLIPQLKSAVQNEEFSLVYQPVIEARSEAINAFEALVRWPNINSDVVPPSEFIPLAEQTGVIKGITNLVIQLAVKQAAHWNKRYPGLRMCINLSALDLQDVHLPDRFNNWLQHFRLPAQMITFEITESAMMQDVDQVKQVLQKLGAMGTGIAVDDFGTGYSSLSLLRDLPTQYIKMDRSFVSNMTQSQEDAAIVKATMQLAHSIGRKFIAEGVETTDVRDLLVLMGCDYIQGYLVSKPMVLEDADRWLIKHKGRELV